MAFKVIQCRLQRPFKHHKATKWMVKHTRHKVMKRNPIQKKGQQVIIHHKFNGRKTANGERYNSALFTAAHKTLPLNSYAVVTNLHNNRKVIVRINDRGPFSEKRIIDLSHSAAKELGLIARGTGQVRIEALHVDHKGQISGAGAKTLAKHAKTQEASDRLVINKNNEKKKSKLRHHHKRCKNCLQAKTSRSVVKKSSRKHHKQTRSRRHKGRN